MEDSPEQVLARLARHRDSLLHANKLPTAATRVATRAPAAPPVLVAPNSVARVQPRPAPIAPPPIASRTPTEFIPPSPYASVAGWRPAQSAVLVTLLGLMCSVGGCVLAVLAFERLSLTLAFGVTAVMVVAGLVGATRRIPVALWWTIGVVIGAALGYWS